jgi:hypothetical protein
MLVEPASNAFPLELIMQAASKRFVGVAIAYKAGIKLDGLVE